MQTPPPVKRKTSVFSWIGFGLSLTVFVIMWVVMISAFSGFDGATNVLVMTLLVSIPLGVLGFVFSIIGLIMAIRNYTPKWMSVCGIVLCCASMMSPVVVAFANNNSYNRDIENMTIKEDCDVLIHISRFGEISCRNVADNYNQVKFSPYNLESELKSWMRMNNFDKNVSIGISVATNADYSTVENVTNCLTNLGYTKYKMIRNKD